MNLTRLNPLTLAERITGRQISTHTRHYFKDSFFFTAANIIPRFLGLLITPLVTLHLTTGEYNTFNVFSNSAITVLCIMLSVQAENSVARYYYENQDDFPDFLGSLFLFTAALAVPMGVQFWIFRDAWSWVFGLPAQRDRLGMTIFLWALGCALVQILHQVYLQILLASRRSRPYFFWNLAKNVLYVAFGIFFLKRFPASGTFCLVWAFVIATGVLGLPFLVFLLRRMRLVFRWEYIRYALHFSLPAMPGVLASFLIVFFDRILFQHNNKDLGGQYTFSYTIGQLIVMVTSGLFSAYMPRFYENMNKGERGANQTIFARNIKLLLLAAFLLTVLSQPMALLLGRNPDYRKGLPIIPVVISANLFAYLGQCYGLYIAFRRKYIWLQSVSQIIAAALNIYLNIWIWHIPWLLQQPLMLMRAAALATLIPFLVQWLIVLLVARLLLKEKTVHFKGLMLPLGAYGAFAVIWSYCGYSGYQQLLTFIQNVSRRIF